jgi:hypothetical protein
LNGVDYGRNNMENAKVYELNRDRISASQPALTVSALSSAKPKLLDQVRQAIRMRHYSYRTEKHMFIGLSGISSFITNAIHRKWARLRLHGFYQVWPVTGTLVHQHRIKP